MNTNLQKLYALSKPCRICPRNCKVDRTQRAGGCGVGFWPAVASYGPHFGEERPLVGTGGSGTIFLGGCNLLCIFCQNHDISHGADGIPASPEQVAAIMLELQQRGCHNINFVTPTHFAAPLAEAILAARKRGLSVPVVYNSSGYDAVETLRLLEGLIDIYMPDAKFWSPEAAERLTGRRDYPEVMRAALREMQRQVGDLAVEGAVATRGLLIRHLVLPADLAGTGEIVQFIAREISPNAYINIMGQYRPCFRAREIPEMARMPTMEEIGAARDLAERAGLRLDE